MDFNNIKELIILTSQNDVEVVRIETDKLKLEISKNSNRGNQNHIKNSDNTVNTNETKTEEIAPLETKESNRETIHAPIAGTFDILKNKDTGKMYKVGDKIAKNSSICSIEAMKNVNLLESEFDGTIDKVLAKASEFVEYNQPLFVINTEDS